MVISLLSSGVPVYLHQSHARNVRSRLPLDPLPPSSCSPAQQSVTCDHVNPMWSSMEPRLDFSAFCQNPEGVAKLCEIDKRAEAIPRLDWSVSSERWMF